MLTLCSPISSALVYRRNLTTQYPHHMGPGQSPPGRLPRDVSPDITAGHHYLKVTTANCINIGFGKG